VEAAGGRGTLRRRRGRRRMRGRRGVTKTLNEAGAKRS